MDIVLINLDKDKERLKRSTKQLEKYGLSFKRIPGVLHDEPWKGFNAAYMNALRAIPNGGIIFEDDVELDRFYIPDLPDDWDLLYFGANLKEPTEPYNDELVRVLGAWTTHAVMYSKKCVKKILEQFDDTYACDDWLKRFFLRENKCYLTTPMQAYQASGFSNLMKQQVDYRKVLDNNYKKYVG